MTKGPTPILARPQGGEILNLQFLRGAAALLVVACHLLERLVKRDLYPIEYRDLAWALGEVGVDTFFAISGFIMVHTTLNSFGERRKARQFIRRRFVRVAPLYYLTTLGMIVFRLVVDRTGALPSVTELAKSLAFIPYPDADGLMRPVYGLGWTLEYEMYFYLLFTLGMCFRARVGLLLVLLVLCLQVAFGMQVATRLGVESELGVIVAYLAQPIVLYFVIGIGIALVYRAFGGASTIRIPDSAVCVLGFAVMLGAAVDLTVPRYLAIGVTVSLLALLRSRTPSRAFSAISRICGDASYSIYLTHSFILGVIALFFAKVGVGGTPALLLYVCIAGAISLAVGWFTWRLVEKPIAAVLKGRQSTAGSRIEAIAP
ncbi:MAG: acyltransferase [Proteobacteria bacterium]|nr:acyltransferase [Pseudomonadota bacterium]